MNQPRFLPTLSVSAACLFAALGTVGWFLAAETWLPDWDSALYLLTAKALEVGAGYTYLDQPFSIRPPGFALFLSLLSKDGTFDLHELNVTAMIWAAVCATSVMVLFGMRYGTTHGLLVALLTVTCPLAADQSRRILSDFPFLACLMLSLACWSQSHLAPRREWIWLCLGALLLIVACYLRTVGVLALPGIFLALPFSSRRRWIASGIATLFVLACLLPWQLHASRVTASHSLADQLLVHSYTTAMFHEDPGDPNSARVTWEGWKQRIAENGRDLFRHAGNQFASNSRWWKSAIAAILLLGLARALLQCHPVDGFFLAYVALLLTYFTYAKRLLLPVLPCLFSYLLLAVSPRERTAASRFTPLLRAAPYALGAVVLVANLGNWTGGQQTAVEERHRTQRFDAIAQWVKSHTAAEDTILYRQAPILSFLTDRRCYSSRFESLVPLIDKYQPNYVILEGKPGGQHSTMEALAKKTWTLEDGARQPVHIYRLTKRNRNRSN